MRNLYIVIAALFLLGSEAWAGVYVEPFVGYASGTTDFNTKISTNSITVSSSFTGLGYGARAGFKTMMFAFGGEYAEGDFKYKSGGGFKPKDIGAFIGVFAPLGFRAWGTYFFSAKAGSIKGKAYKLGIGYRFARFMALNLEYLAHSYNDITIAPATVSTSAKTYFISLSIPISIP